MRNIRAEMNIYQCDWFICGIKLYINYGFVKFINLIPRFARSICIYAALFIEIGEFVTFLCVYVILQALISKPKQHGEKLLYPSSVSTQSDKRCIFLDFNDYQCLYYHRVNIYLLNGTVNIKRKCFAKKCQENV